MGWSRASAATGLLAAALLAAAPLHAVAEDDPKRPAPAPALVPGVPVLRTLPPFFEENGGQAPPDVRYVGRSQDGMIGIRDGGVVFVPPASNAAVDVHFPGGAAARPAPAIPLPGRVSFFLEGQRSVRAGGLPTFGAVRQPGVWPGVDVEWTYGEGGLLLRILLAPGADPSKVRLGFPGATGIAADPDGALVVTVPPPAYLPNPGPVGIRLAPPEGARFAALPGNVAALEGVPPARDGETVLESEVRGLRKGGCWFEGVIGTAAAPDGTFVLSGRTTALASSSVGNPTRDPRMARTDVFVARVDPSGTVLRSLAWYGGDGGETPRSMAVGADGSVAVVGHTLSTDLPTTPGAFRPRSLRTTGSFVVKFNPACDGLVFASWLGGLEARNTTDGTAAWAVALGRDGAVYVAGEAGCYDFPFTGIPEGAGPGPALPAERNPRRGTPGGPFLAKFRPDGKSLEYCVPLSTQARATFPSAVAVDPEGGAWVTGRGGGIGFPSVKPLPGRSTERAGTFVLRVSPDAKQLTTAGLLPCTADITTKGLLLDGKGRPVLAGEVRGKDFPVKNAAMESFDGPDWDFFVSRLQRDGADFEHSSYLGFGVGNTELHASLALDSKERAIVAGSTTSIREWTDTPMERRHLVQPRWFFTVWSPEGRILRTEDVDMAGSVVLGGFVAAAPNGVGALGGTLREEAMDPFRPLPQAVRDQVFLVLLDLEGRGLFPAPPEGIPERFRMRPVKREGEDGAAAPVAKEDGAAGRGAGNPGGGAAASGGEAGDGTGDGSGADGGKDGVLDRRVKGLIVDRPLVGADRLRFEGRFDTGLFEELGGFDPATDSLVLAMGAKDAPFLFRIPAGDARWTAGEGGRIEWRSTKDADAFGRVVLNPERGTFFVRLYGFDFPGPQANPVVVEFRLGRLVHGETKSWTANGRGVFRYPE